MAFSGIYELVKNEGLMEHLIAVGVPGELAKKNMLQTKFEISLNGDKVGVQVADGQLKYYILNQEVEEKIPDGKIFKTKVELNGNVLTITTNTENGTWKREYTLSGSELTMVSSHSKAGIPVAKRTYKKL